MDKPQLTDMDLYCIARLIQNSFQAPRQESIENIYRPLYGCMYCKYAMPECNKPGNMNLPKVFEKLKKLTGVNISTLVPAPERLGSVFLPASHYIEHPEDLSYLKEIHDDDTVEKIRACLDKVINRSKESLGQGQGNDLHVGNHEDIHNDCQ